MNARWLIGAAAVLAIAGATAAWAGVDREALFGPTPVVVEPAPWIDTACSDDPTSRLGLTLSLAVWRGGDVSERQVQRQLARAAAYWVGYDVKLTTSEPIRTLEMDALFDGAAEDCEAALAPLRAFAAAHAQDPAELTLVVLDELAPQDSVVAQRLPHLRGVTFAPGVQNAISSCMKGEVVGPVVVLGLAGIAERPKGTVEIALAHELGRVLGLEQADGDDLMATVPPTCRPLLRLPQVEHIRSR
jgi:hypothetical protein